jgi:O-antigen ligase
MLVAHIEMSRGGGFGGWVDNPNTLGLMLAPSIVVFMAGCIERRPGWILRHLVFLIVALYLTWISDARAAIVWVGLSAVGFWIYRRGVLFGSISTILALVVLIGWWYPIKMWIIHTLGLDWSLRNTGISPLSGREEVWRIGVNLFQERPILGYGVGSSQTLLLHEEWRFVRTEGLHFHSSYIQVLVETGLLGFIAFMATLGTALARGLADATRTRALPRESWPLAALPWVLILGALGHAVFESWLFAAGNVNMPLFWAWFWLVFHQTQIKIRAVPVESTPRAPIVPGTPSLSPAR